MSQTLNNVTPEQRANQREKRRVALTSLLAAVLLTGMKLTVGLLTGSLGILSEAAHSGLDLVAAAMTFWAVRISAQPPDPDHPYGHGKFENLSALFETLLLLLTCVWIVYEGVRRLVHAEGPEFQRTELLVGLAVMCVSIIVDWSRSRALQRVALKTGSQALEADALHFSTDIWSSSVVILGLLLVLLAGSLGPDWRWLEKADIFAALSVAGIVVWVSLKLARKALDDLLDAAPLAFQEQVRRAARVPGVQAVGQVRVRRSGPETFVDVTLTVARATAFERAHEIATAAEGVIRRVLPGADVIVHVEPSRLSANGPVGGETPDEAVLRSAREEAMKQGLGAHSLQVLEQDGRRSLEIHLEVPAGLSLAEAHALATRFEDAVRAARPELDRIVSHIEPAEESAPAAATPANADDVLELLRDFKDVTGLPCDPHDLAVLRVAGTLCVSFHCSLNPHTPIHAAHEFTERVEAELRRRVPGLGRVLIHVEPAEERPGA